LALEEKWGAKEKKNLRGGPQGGTLAKTRGGTRKMGFAPEQRDCGRGVKKGEVGTKKELHVIVWKEKSRRKLVNFKKLPKGVNGKGNQNRGGPESPEDRKREHIRRPPSKKGKEKECRGSKSKGQEGLMQAEEKGKKLCQDIGKGSKTGGKNCSKEGDKGKGNLRKKESNEGPQRVTTAKGNGGKRLERER